ncbi:MAG: glycosyltransferase [Verrucomicrobiota bacterium]|nr:glycosyltransferase [Verrucomicrobiota bacterium]
MKIKHKDILLLTGNLTSPQGGASISGLDVLMALSNIPDAQLTVLAQATSILKDKYVKNVSFKGYYIPPTFPKDKTILNHLRYIKNLIVYPINTFIFKHKKYRVCIVNGIGNHDKFVKVSNILPHNCQKILIVRESPRHFTELKLNKVKSQFKLYDYLIFVSSNCQSEWCDVTGYPTENTFYIPNCAPEEKINVLMKKSKLQTKRELNLSEDRFVVASVASIIPRKGQDKILKITDNLIEKIPNLLFLFIGPNNNDEYFKDFLSKINTDKNKDYFKYFGKKSNALEYIYASNAMVLTSNSEAMPRVILESMALKTPVITSNVDGCSELIEHEKNGFLFDDQSLDKVVDYLRLLSCSKEAGHNLIMKSYEKYKVSFTRKHLNQRYNEMLKQVLN